MLFRSEGALYDGAKTATFSMAELKIGDTITIAGKQYNIGTEDKAAIVASIEVATAGELVTIDGTQYTVARKDASDVNVDKNILTIASITAKIAEGSTALYNGKTYHVMKDKDTIKGVDDADASVITTKVAYAKIHQELRLANNIGVDSSTQASVTYSAVPVNEKINFFIEKGQRELQERLHFGLHVGADSDMSNKIIVSIDALDTRGLGIRGLNVKDDSGAAATYAIDAIADAVAQVSAQRSLLGAVQNRLEHTINNLDNVVENTTAAESQIRDTDMATEMVKFSNNNILAQAGQSMLAQSNQANQGVLSLLQ